MPAGSNSTLLQREMRPECYRMGHAGEIDAFARLPRQDGSCPHFVSNAAVRAVLQLVPERVSRHQGFDQFQQQLDCIFHICQRGRFHRGVHIAQGTDTSAEATPSREM